MPKKKKQEKKAVHRRRSNRERGFGVQVAIGGIWIVSLCALVYGIYHVTHLPVFTIDEIQVEGGETISHEIVRSKVETAIRGSYLLVVPKRFTYTYPKEEVLSAVESVPRIKDVRITKEGKKKLSVTFDEFQPHALWCGETNEQPCYFVDTEGYAFDTSPFGGGGTLMRHIVEGVELSRGESLPHEGFRMAEGLAGRIEEGLGFRIASVLYKENGDMELTVGGGGRFFVATGMDPELTYENLEVVLTSEAYEHIAPGSFNYVDVRFEKKVFVNEELEKENATSTDEVATSSELIAQ